MLESLSAYLAARHSLRLKVDRGFCPWIQGGLPLCALYSAYFAAVDTALLKRYGMDHTSRKHVVDMMCSREAGSPDVRPMASARLRQTLARRIPPGDFLPTLNVDGREHASCLADMALLLAAAYYTMVPSDREPLYKIFRGMRVAGHDDQASVHGIHRTEVPQAETLNCHTCSFTYGAQGRGPRPDLGAGRRAIL